MLPSAGVITVVAGRHQHLRAQRAFLAACRPRPLLHVVVAVQDPGVPGVLAEQRDLPTILVSRPGTAAGLPVAAARNAGARAALAAGAQALIFLDVDCLPAASLIGDYERAARRRPGALLCGPVTYLPPAPAAGWTPAGLLARRHPHPARPDPPAGTMCPVGPAQFWSLSFAVSAATWQELPPFYEGYVGYGGEDTDYACSAVRAGAEIVFLGGADAFHQHHPVASPPVEHLDDILRNAAVFARRQGRLPMTGWLDDFAARGLITLARGLPRRVRPVRLATIPSRHPYLDAVLPSTVHRHDPGRVTAWEADPLLQPEVLADRAGEVDVIHVHFGFDQLSHEQLARWLTQLHGLGLPLVLTVHDLRNPHHEHRARHDGHLQLMIRAAARVLTLTQEAAQECERRFGRRPDVIPHPTLLAAGPPLAGSPAAGPEPGSAPVVLVPLKALRRNVRQPAEVVAAVAAGARRAGARTRVLMEPAAARHPEAGALHQLAAAGRIELDVAAYLPEDQLADRVARAHACVLPYQFGTHSGWVELCRDLGTRVIAPDCGLYASQWPEVITYRNNERDKLDPASLSAAVQAACRRPPPAPAEQVGRLAQRDVVQALHDALYREIVAP